MRTCMLISLATLALFFFTGCSSNSANTPSSRKQQDSPRSTVSIQYGTRDKVVCTVTVDGRASAESNRRVRGQDIILVVLTLGTACLGGGIIAHYRWLRSRHQLTVAAAIKGLVFFYGNMVLVLLFMALLLVVITLAKGH